MLVSRRCRDARAIGSSLTGPARNTPAILIVADAGAHAGLGHISRSSALGVALRARGLAVHCYAYGAPDSLVRDGIEWVPVDSLLSALESDDASVVVLDSYRLDPSALRANDRPVVLMQDHLADAAPPAALVVNVSEEHDGSRPERLYGFEYACLRPQFWGVPGRVVSRMVEHVLVTSGAADPGGAAGALAGAVKRALPTARVTLVEGPYGRVHAPTEVDTLVAPGSLFDALVASDLVVCAGGQTMLETAAVGTPAVVVPLVDNQQRQSKRLAERGAITLVEAGDLGAVARAVEHLAADFGARQDLSARAQRTIDGYGALRVAFHVARLATACEIVAT
jgi:UDP-2,4-diacetamido-2,4,6-trideoxy-beta-L-altropyranose hydrolase